MQQYINPNKFWKRKFYQKFRFFNEKVPKSCDWKKMYIDMDKASKINTCNFEHLFDLPPEIIQQILNKLDEHSLKNFEISAKQVIYRDELIDIREFTNEIWKNKKYEYINNHTSMNMITEILNQNNVDINTVNTSSLLGLFNYNWKSTIVNRVLNSDYTTCSDDELFVYEYKKLYMVQIVSAKLNDISFEESGFKKLKKFIHFIEFISNNLSYVNNSINFKNMLFSKLVENKINIEVYFDWYMYKIFNIIDTKTDEMNILYNDLRIN